MVLMQLLGSEASSQTESAAQSSAASGMAPAIFRFGRKGGKEELPATGYSNNTDVRIPEMVAFDCHDQSVLKDSRSSSDSSSVEHLKQQNRRLEETVETKTQEVLALQKTIDMLVQECDQHRDNVDRVQGRLDKAKTKAQQDNEPTGAITAARKQISDLHGELSTRQKEIFDLRREVFTLKEENASQKEAMKKSKEPASPVARSTAGMDMIQNMYEQAGLCSPSTGLNEQPTPLVPSKPQSEVQRFVEDHILKETAWWDQLQAMSEKRVELVFSLEQGPKGKLSRKWKIASSEVRDEKSISIAARSMNSSLTSLTIDTSQSSKSSSGTRAVRRQSLSASHTFSKSASKSSTRRHSGSHEKERHDTDVRKTSRDARGRSASTLRHREDRTRSSSIMRNEKSSTRQERPEKLAFTGHKKKAYSSSKRSSSASRARPQTEPKEGGRMKRRASLSQAASGPPAESPREAAQEFPDVSRFHEGVFDPFASNVVGHHATIVCDARSNASSLSSGSGRRTGRRHSMRA